MIPKHILNQANEFKGESTECTLAHEYRRDPQNSFASFKMRNGMTHSAENSLAHTLEPKTQASIKLQENIANKVIKEEDVKQNNTISNSK